VGERDPEGVTYSQLPRPIGVAAVAYLVKVEGETIGRVIRSGSGRAVQWKAYAADGRSANREGYGFMYRADAARALVRLTRESQ